MLLQLSALFSTFWIYAALLLDVKSSLNKSRADLRQEACARLVHAVLEAPSSICC